MINARAGKIEDWAALLADRPVQGLSLTLQQVNKAFAESSDPLAAKYPEQGAPDKGFIRLCTAVVTIRAMGRSLLVRLRPRSAGRIKPGRRAMLLTATAAIGSRGRAMCGVAFLTVSSSMPGDTRSVFMTISQTPRSIAAEGAPALRTSNFLSFHPNRDSIRRSRGSWTSRCRATGPEKRRSKPSI